MCHREEDSLGSVGFNKLAAHVCQSLNLVEEQAISALSLFLCIARPANDAALETSECNEPERQMLGKRDREREREREREN